MAQNRGRYFPTKSDAILLRLLRQGIFNIDVGCMQTTSAIMVLPLIPSIRRLTLFTILPMPQLS